MSTSNTSATGGYLLPAASIPLPQNLSLEDFLQTMIAGISGFPGDLVRPKWQINPPKQPDVTVNWIAFGLQEDDSDTNAFTSANPDGSNIFMRMEALTLQCTFYGPDSLEVGKIVRDGLQIPQNLETLQLAKMSFVSTSKMVRAPDLINERWVDRWEMSINLRREILRTYPILTFLSASGTLYALQSNGVKGIVI
ncbi:MAG: hypothetical protein ACHQXJ_02420 [Nitrososphaerales archaeon]